MATWSAWPNCRPDGLVPRQASHGSGRLNTVDQPPGALPGTDARYLTTQAKDDSIEYVHHAIGYNYRLTNLLAAMGCAQMEQLDAFVEAKRQIAKRYQEALVSLPGIRLPEEAGWAFTTFWMYTVLIDEKKSRLDSRGLLRQLGAWKIQARPLWQPIHRSPAHDPAGSPSCPNSDALHAQAISLPCSVGLTHSAQGHVIETIASLLGEQNQAARTS